jgi:hypothetical protein
MRYGSLEFAYAAPFANALAEDETFRIWILRQTKFSRIAPRAKLLNREMRERRAKSAQNWWRSHFTEKCRCDGCSGQETDILAIFEGNPGERFALHIEVKQPTDRFPPGKDQAKNYALRAQCWIKSPPKAILPHAEADTMLLCSASKLDEYTPHLPAFGAVVTFEEVAKQFPKAVAGSVMSAA